MAARHRKCPTPSKVVYPSREAALRAVRRMPLDRGEVRAYRCKGHYHLTSRTRR